MPLPDNQLYSLILNSKTLDEKDARTLLLSARSSQTSFYDAIVQKGSLSDHSLGKLIAGHLNVPFVELSKISIPGRVLNIIPERIARKHKVIVFALDNTNVKIGMSNPVDQRLIDMIAHKTSRKVISHLATDADIANALQLYERNIQETVERLIRDELGNSSVITSDAPIIKIVDLIITSAYREKSSDIHIETDNTSLLVRFRIDSVLHDILRIPKNLQSGVITRIKVLSQLRTDEHQDAQDGKMRLKVDDENLDIRVSIIPTTEGEKAVLRLLSSKFRSFSLADLGMSEPDLEKIRAAIARSDGCILSTGPTGSGKTTSIYSLLKILNTRDKNITTVEDPVEYRINGVNHIPVNTRSGFTFAKGLRSILRQDPDIIFVGEIRDTETANLAVNAALTGHLVLSTLHTNDAATALPRLIDMQAEPFLISSTVNVILAQRLVRKICLLCKTSRIIKRDDLRKNIPDKTWKFYFGPKTDITVYKGKGCKSCHNTGYSGRIGIFEVLKISENIRRLIMERKNSTAIRSAAISEGMTTLLDDGIGKVMSGKTTIEEVLRVIKIEDL